MGSEIQVFSKGGSKYEVNINYYRDCRGDSIGKKDWKLRWYIANDTGYVTGDTLATSKLIRASIRDITPRCSTQNGPCNPLNTTFTGEGVEQHQLTYELDLSSAPFNSMQLGSKYCILGISFSAGKRASAFTTGLSSTNHWISASINFCNLNSCSKKSISETYFNDYPFSFACCNQSLITSVEEIDTANHDSFSYDLIPAAVDERGTAATYASPFEYKYPLTPYCVPSTTIKCTPNYKTNPPRGFYFGDGAMVFTPIKCDETSLVTYASTKWRKNTSGVYIPLTVRNREFAIVVKDNCGYNQSPQITGPTVNAVCESDKICFDIDGKDETFTPFQTIPDTVQVTWNHGIPGATFVVKNPNDREKTAQFCWQTRVGDASEVAYNFTVTATDNHCPKPAITIRNFRVTVYPKASDSRQYTCLGNGSLKAEAILPAGFHGTAQCKWSVRDSTGQNESYFSTKLIDTLPMPYPGKVIIIHTINNDMNCPSLYMDTVLCYPLKTKDLSWSKWSLKNPVTAGEKLLLPENYSGDIYWYSADGKMVYKSIQQKDYSLVPQLKPGIYFMELKQGTSVRKEKILVQ